MKLNGFAFSSDQIGVESGRSYFDLHNNFDFSGLTYSVVERVIILDWTKGNRAGVPADSPKKLSLRFEGVGFLRAKQRDSDIPFTEDDCLRTIGFFWNDMIEEMSVTDTSVPMEGCSHLLIDFMSGFAIKLSAENAYLRLDA
jgi:hypothetical protein